MAFDSEFDAIYSKYIKPSLQDLGYEVTRADSLLNQQNILKDIIRQISNADLVIAELSTPNPNVFYELGVAHALRKRTVLITQSIDDLPFDLRSYRVISYSTHFDEITKLSTSLTKVAEGAKSNTIDFGNPVIDFLPSELSLAKPMEEGILIPSSNEEKGLWDYAKDGEAGMVAAVDFLNRLNITMNKITERTTERTIEINRVKESNISGSAAKMYRLMELTAIDILGFAQTIETELPKFSLAWDNISENTTNMLRMSVLKSQEDKVAAIKMSDVFSTIAKQLPVNIETMKSLRETQAQMKGISKSMNMATRKAISAIDQVIAEYEKALSYSVKVIDLISEKLIAEH